jgi:hypothetical protein
MLWLCSGRLTLADNFLINAIRNNTQSGMYCVTRSEIPNN